MAGFLTPLNWTLGTLFILVAAFYPVIDDKFITGSRQTAAEQVVDRIVRVEQRHFQLNESYLLFGPGEMPPAIQDQLGLTGNQRQDYEYEVFQDAKEGTLVVRARALDARIQAGDLPPLVYTWKKNLGSGQVRRSWDRLSGKKPGLL